MTTWKTYKLRDVVQFNPTERIAKGTLAKKVSMDKLIPYCREVSGYNLESFTGGMKFRNGDTIMARITPCLENGKTSYVSFLEENEIGFGSTEYIVFRAIKDVTDSKFIYYFVTNPTFRSIAIKSMVGSSGRQRVQQSVLEELEISLPSLEEQRRIAGILGAIDDKIENNRRINTNLELQAQALYKQWFVDNRNDDWEERPLSEIIFFQEGPGIRNWQYVEKKGVRFINIRCINDGDVNVQNANMISENEACGKYAHFLLKPLDIVMSCSGTLGRYAIIRQEHLPLCLNTSVIRFRPAKCIEDYSFVYGYLSSTEFLNKQEEMACGSVQANFGPTHLKQIKIQVPPKDYRTKYNNVVMPIITAMLKNRTEMNILSSLRDTLLPKLMNGEIQL